MIHSNIWVTCRRSNGNHVHWVSAIDRSQGESVLMCLGVKYPESGSDSYLRFLPACYIQDELEKLLLKPQPHRFNLHLRIGNE